MARVENIKPFPAAHFHGLDRDGREILVVCAAGSFALPSAGSAAGALARLEVQEPPPMADEYWGEPGASSLRREGQTAYVRQGTDIYIQGSACAPRGGLATHAVVRARVGPCQKELRVTGDRVWRRGLFGLRPSTPVPFDTLPLTYERAFGGCAAPKKGKPPKYEPRNPVGRGFYGRAKEAVGKLLPNIEESGERVSRWSDRVTPAGFGPITRSWLPRRDLAGTYDDAWLEHRAPLWPDDLDDRFFNAAAPGMVAFPNLTGGEPVTLEGFDPAGTIAFRLPKHRLALTTVFRHRKDRREMVLDGVSIDVDARRLALYWRASVTVEREMEFHEHCLIRELEDGETLSP
jgi:hypothetical protein